MYLPAKGNHTTSVTGDWCTLELAKSSPSNRGRGGEEEGEEEREEEEGEEEREEEEGEEEGEEELISFSVLLLLPLCDHI